MSELRQGQVRWAELPAPIGRRPVVVLTRDDAIRRLSNVTVAPVTRSIRGIPTEVILTPAHGVPSLCAVSLDNIETVRKSVIGPLIAALDDATLEDIFTAIRHAFAMPR